MNGTGVRRRLESVERQRRESIWTAFKINLKLLEEKQTVQHFKENTKRANGWTLHRKITIKNHSRRAQ